MSFTQALIRAWLLPCLFFLLIVSAFGQEYRTGTGNACSGKVRVKSSLTIKPAKANRSRVGNRRVSLFDWHATKPRVSRRLLIGGRGRRN